MTRRPPTRARLAAVVAGLALATVAGWYLVAAKLAVGPPVDGVTAVTMTASDFTPDAIRIPAGTAVTWRFHDRVEHNVTGDGFASPTRTGGTFTHTFDEPGVYGYRCTLHGPMRGRLIVGQ